MDKLNHKQISDKAVDVLEIFRMWDIDRMSAIAIAQQMVLLASATSDQNWTNPLAGTGLAVPGGKKFLLPGLGGPANNA